MAKFTHHIFICCNQRPEGHPRGCCDATGSEALKDCFKRELAARGLKGEVRANSAGCLDQCELGPAVVIYPQAIWYGGVTLADVSRIIEETIVQGRVVEDLLIADELLNSKCAKKPLA
jgi:(2Fe-2S) ferredoxin